jgi:hypothetical protein
MYSCRRISTTAVIFTHFTLKMEASWPSETILSYCRTTRRHGPKDNVLINVILNAIRQLNIEKYLHSLGQIPCLNLVSKEISANKKYAFSTDNVDFIISGSHFDYYVYLKWHTWRTITKTSSSLLSSGYQGLFPWG